MENIKISMCTYTYIHTQREGGDERGKEGWGGFIHSTLIEGFLSDHGCVP